MRQQTGSPYLRVQTGVQTLEWISDQGEVVWRWPVSTARNGLGERRGSECTPRGWHQIRAKIGAGQPSDAIFRGRRPTGQIYNAALEAKHPGQDWILTRILWLSGLEPGFNRYGEVDTAWRFIYIHGSPQHGVDGSPRSHGCIRLNSPDMLDLFSKVSVGMRLLVQD